MLTTDTTELKTVDIYTDGSCFDNPGPGGWCAILVYEQYEKELRGNKSPTTNSEMELLAIYNAVKAIKYPCNLNIYSDSAYICNAFNKGWITTWEAKDWKKSDNKPVAHADIWKNLLSALRQHNFDFKHIDGHSGHIYNERCDFIAKTEAAKVSKISC